MLFGDDKRFGKSFVPTKKDTQVLGVQAISTEEVVGPGSYHNTGLEEQRNGWGRRSFSRRQPMTPPAKKPVFGRTDSFTAGGVVTSYGALSQPLSDKDIMDSPGPGYYSSSIFSFGATNSKHISATSQTPGTPRGTKSRNVSAANSVANYTTQSTGLSTSKRFAFDQSACLKGGVLFLSAENNHKEVGPGYYSYNLDTLSKPSFNIRATNGKNGTSPNSRPGSASRRQSFNNSFNNSFTNIPVSVSSGNSINSGSYGTRPRSASSGRLRHL